MNSNEIQIHDQPIVIDNENIKENENIEQNKCKNITYDGKNIIDSIACSKALCFATGNQIQFFNETYTEHIATVTLDCIPEHLCFSRNENFIIIADNMGRIHFFHLHTRNIIFSQQIIQPNKNSNSSCFLSLCFNTKKESNIEELFIILRDYTLLKFSNIDLIKLEESINKNDLALANEIKKNISIETLDIGQTVNSPHHQSINDMVIYKSKDKENIIIAGSGKYSLSVWTYSPKLKKTIMIDGIGEILNNIEILKIKVDEEGKYLFALDEFKRLLVFSLEWLILLYEFSNTDIIDFCILPNDTMSDDREIVVLAEHKMKKIKRYLEIIKIPNYQILHRIEINKKSWLIKNEKPSQIVVEKKEAMDIDHPFKNENLLKDLYFIEENSSMENTVNIRLLSEIIPINLFQYMINNKKFDEALDFAEKNNLNKQDVLKPKLTDLLEKINSSSKEKYDIQQIINDLSQMNDFNFILHFCLDLKLSTYDDTLAILNFANQLIQNSNINQRDNNFNYYDNDNNNNNNNTNNNNNNNNNNIDNNNDNRNDNIKNDDQDMDDSNSKPKNNDLIIKVQQYIKRLGTYILVKKGSNLTKDILFDSDEWQSFKNSDIIEDIKKLFYYGKISLGIVIWRRHLIESKKDLIYNICDILDNIPIEVPVEDYIKWLKYEVLTILNPDERSYIYIWIEQRARLVENYEKSPHNALKLMKLIDNNKTVYDSFETVFSSKYKTFIAPTPMHHVDNIILLAHTSSYSIFQNKTTIESMEENKLKHQLQDLVYLWDVHNYKISLEKYDQSEPEGIAFDMLDKIVASELLDKTIKEHFIPYVNKNNINKDKLLSDYCFELMDQTTATTFDVSMEERILTILRNITDNEFKVNALLEFMRRISVPWSEEVNDMILEMLIVPNKRLNELKGQYRLMQFKLMLLDYEIKSYNISKMSMAKGLIKYILSFTSRPNAIDDALQVINTYHHLNSYDAYIIRIINLCKEEKLNEVLYLIRHGRENEDSQRNRNNKNYQKFNIQHFVEKKLKDSPEKIEELENTLYEIFYGEEDNYTLEDGIMIGRNIIRWLIENIEEIITSITDQGYIIINKEYQLSEENVNSLIDQGELEEAITKYRWVIKFIVAIINLLFELEEENDTGARSQDNRFSRVNIPYVSSNGWSEDVKQKMKTMKQYFENINILFNEFGVMVSINSYKNKEFRKNLLIKFTHISLSQNAVSSELCNSDESSRTLSNINSNTNINININTNINTNNTNINGNMNDIKRKEEKSIKTSHSSSSINSMTSINKFKDNSSRYTLGIEKDKLSNLDNQDFSNEKSLLNRKRSSNNLLEINDIFNDNHSNLYRFSEILCISRNEFKGILAMEATAYGDYEVAILQGKELFKKNKNKETAQILRSIINQTISNVLNNSISFKNIKKNDRFTTQIQLISQKALSICDENEIDEYLNVYKNCELMNFVFSQCDSGDYTTLIRNNKENEQNFLNQNISSSSYTLVNEDDEESCSTSSSNMNNYYNNIFKFVQSSVKKQKQYHTNEDKYLTEKYGNSIFAEQYQEHFLILNTEKAMTMCMDFILSNKITFDQEFSRKNKKADYDPLKSGHDLITYLLSNKCVMSSLNLANLILEYIYRRGTLLGDNYIDQIDINSYSRLIKISLENTLYSRQIDEHLLLGYLLCLPMNKAANIFKAAIKSLDNDYYRTIKFASIGALVGRVWNQRNFQVGCLEAGKHAKWFYQFKCLNIPFSQTLFKNSENNDYQRSLVSCFLLKSNLDIFTVLEFARNYHIEDDFVILEYIKLMLIEKNSDVTDDYQSKIVGVIDEVANKEKLLAMLTDICLPQVSPYDYEKLLFIYEQMDRLIGNEETIKKHLMVLEILSSYKRTLPPNKEEFQIYLEINIDNNKLEELINQYPLCKSRLSFFSLIKSPWKILSPELIDEGNLPKLLPLRIPLDIPIDEFFIRIVDVVLKKMTDGMKEQNEDSNASKYRFSDIKLYLLKCIPSHTIIEKTIYAASQFPKGKERIEGYQLALYIVEKYLEILNQNPEKNEKSIEECNIAKTNINYWLAITKTEYQMMSMGYNDFVNYCTNPTELIIKLYEQKSVDVLMGKDNIDLHSVANEIAERHGLNIEKIRQTLIQKWISKEPTYTQEEKECYLPSMRIWMNNLGLDSTPNSESRIQMILLYIFRSGQKKQRIKTLLNPICKSTKLKHHIRIRALSVLFQLASPDELNEFIDYNKLRNYMQTCLYLADFEDLNIHQSSVEFESCNKKSLVKSLLLHHYNEPKVAQIISNICMDYQIYDLEIWDNVIRLLIDSKRYIYLLDILDYISTIPEMLQMKSLFEMWNEIIIECLKIYRNKLKSYPLTIDAVYIKILSLINRCPFVLELDIDNFLNQFKEIIIDSNNSLEIEYKSSFLSLISGLSGLCVLPLQPSVQSTFMESLSSLSSQTLIAILDYFFECKNDSSQFSDNFDLNYVFRFIENGIYEVIMRKNEYHILVNTRYIDDLINYSINNDNIQNILLLSLKNRMYQTALNIVTSYYQKYKEKLENIENINETHISKLFLLKKYIKDHHEFEKEKTLIDNVFNELEHKSSS